MRADVAACDGSRASHQGLADGYAALIAAARVRRDPPAASLEGARVPVATAPNAVSG